MRIAVLSDIHSNLAALSAVRENLPTVDEIWVLADNRGAEAFYAACGFRRGEAHEQGLLMLASCKI